MIVCPNCTHQNPDGAQVCEACYTELPALTTCPHCGATVQQDATFCGQCGTALKSTPTPDASEEEEVLEIPPLVELDPLVIPDPIAGSSAASSLSEGATELEVEQETSDPGHIHRLTELQSPTAALVHITSNNRFELSTDLAVLHIGKPNDRLPPEIDVSGFPHADVVSRVHAAIHIDKGDYYIEDLGSSNGTYINHLPLTPGNRQRLKTGDRITLGKNDLVSFLFEL